MDPNEQASGVFDVLATEAPELATHLATVKETKTTEEAPKPEPKTETKTASEEEKTKPVVKEAEEEEPDNSKDTQSFDRNPESEEAETETPETIEPSQTEKPETKAETQVDEDWKKTLPPPPPEYNGPTPEYDAEGFITNMSPQQYDEYLIGKAESRSNQRNYQSIVENRALDVAEQILPEIKTNPTVRQLVENQRIAQVVNGQEGDVVSAAKAIKELLGVSQQQLAEATAKAKAEGATNAKTQIIIQKNAAVETPTVQKKTTPSKADKLGRRLKQGDDDAFAELFDMWDKDGKLN
jgi:hypothetical protein